jgi:hypothetical protein
MVPPMDAMTPERLEALVAAGCPRCKAQKLAFQSYVEGRFPLLAGEPVGRVAWASKGADFCAGVFEVACVACKQIVFADAACPGCRRAGGLADALESENRFEVPRSCPRCATEAVRYAAKVPATVVHHGAATGERSRGEPARTQTELLDPGFHGIRAECKECGTFAIASARCPLCDG